MKPVFDPACPELIESEEILDEVMTRPRQALIEFIKSVRSPLVILGAGGKMGPSLAVLARRAAETAGHALEVIAVSRFSNVNAQNWLEQRGVRTLKCDLLQPGDAANLPDARDIIYLVGSKFGTTQNPALTWAVNALPPARVLERFRHSRIVALSTGNVYPMVDVDSGGSVENDPLTPLGEYANACVGRERILEFCQKQTSALIALIRLNYAVDLRYGVLVDTALKVFQNEPVDLTMGHFNCIWQADANDMIIRALDHAQNPPAIFNLTGPEQLSVRTIALRFGELLGRTPQFSGAESATALLSNSAKACSLFGHPPTSLDTVMRWTAQWIRIGGRLLNKPTHFEVRNGKF